MPKKNFSVVLDHSHGELLNLSDEEFRPFGKLLEQMNCALTVHNSGKINSDILVDADLLIVGCPINHYFLYDEISDIMDFIINGGCLLIASEYGGDSVQKTNINDLTRNFGIYFENTAIRTKDDTGSTSLPLITKLINHDITKGIRKIMLGGTCTIRTAKNAYGICMSGPETWVEIYDDLNNVWIKHDDHDIPLIAANTYGQGRVVALGDIDVFGSNPRFGLSSLDNRKLIENIFAWFDQPVRSDITIEWILHQIANYRQDIGKLNTNFKNLIDTVQNLEHRITTMEERQDDLYDSLTRLWKGFKREFEIELKEIIDEDYETDDKDRSDRGLKSELKQELEKRRRELLFE